LTHGKPLTPPKTDREPFPARMAKSWTHSKEYTPRADNDNALMDQIEHSRSLIQRRDIRYWTAPRNFKPPGEPLVGLIDNGPSRSDNDNDRPDHTVNWPLEKALKADAKSERRLNAATIYRQLDSVAQNQRLQGDSFDTERDSIRFDQFQWRDEKTGEFKYKGVRKSKSKKGKGTTFFGVGVPGAEFHRTTSQQPKKWNGDDPIHRYMDAKALLPLIAEVLGPLKQVTDSAVLFDQTFEYIGRLHSEYLDSVRCSAIGKTLVGKGLDVLASLFETPTFKARLKELELSAH